MNRHLPTMADLAINIEALFALLSNATVSIPEKHKNKVFQDMAYKLIEWYTVSRVELRKIFYSHDIVLKELCYDCNAEILNILVDPNDDKPQCNECYGRHN